MMLDEVQEQVQRWADPVVSRWFRLLMHNYGLLPREAHRVIQRAIDAELKNARDRSVAL